MDNLFSFLSTNTIFITITTSLLLIYYTIIITSWRAKKTTTKNTPPPPPEAGGAWPLIGHLHKLGGPDPPHKVLGNMADKYGPIFTIKMGVHKALVINNSELAKECLATKDKVFATRPKFLAAEVMAYDHGMFGFSPYGPYWRTMRKITTLELLSNQRLETFKNVRENEVKIAASELFKLWELNRARAVLVDGKEWFSDITLNVIFRIIVGKSVGYNDQEAEWERAIRVFFDLSGRFVVADALPFLRWLDVGGHERTMKKTAKELDVVVEEWLKEHKEKK